MENGASPIAAAAVVSTVGGAPTPMMTITATALSGRKATKLTRAATTAFLGVVRSRQLAAKIPVRDRIQLRVVKSADEPKLVKPRSKALPMLVLLAGLIATAAVAFTRDNVTRRRTARCSRQRRRRAIRAPLVGRSRTPPALGPVPSPDAATAREEAGSSIGARPRPFDAWFRAPRGLGVGDGVPARLRNSAPRLRQARTQDARRARRMSDARVVELEQRSEERVMTGSSSRTVEQSQLDARPRVRVSSWRAR